MSQQPIINGDSGLVTRNKIDNSFNDFYNKPNIYKTKQLGEIYKMPHESSYFAWAPSNLQFDSTRDTFVVLMNGADEHIFSTVAQYIAYVDKDTLEMSKLQTCLFDVAIDDEAICHLLVHPTTGVYTIIARVGGNNYRYTSVDGGLNFVQQNLVVGLATTHLWGLYRMSSGRILGGNDTGAVQQVDMFYSDDEGETFTNLILTNNGGGDYFSEPHIIELETSYLMALYRKNGAGVGTVTSGESDPALITFSEDDGLTWTDLDDSLSIDDMNASTASGIVHDGIVEIFACSRWYHDSSDSNANYDRTKKNGAINHYTATIADAKLDRFEKLEPIVYANAIGNTSSQDFHAPCLAIDDAQRILIMYFDRIYPYTDDATLYNFISGQKGSFKDSRFIDAPKELPYDLKRVEFELEKRDREIESLKAWISQIAGSPIPAPIGNEIITYEYDFNKIGVLPDNTAPFYNTIYSSASVPEGFAGFDYKITESTLDSDKDILKIRSTQLVSRPTKANFMFEIKVHTSESLGFGIYLYDGTNYYGVLGTGAVSMRSGDVYKVSEGDFAKKFRTIKVLKINGEIFVTVDNYKYPGKITTSDGNLLIDKYATTTYHRYDPLTDDYIGGEEFDAGDVANIPMLIIGGANNIIELEYFKFGEWD